MARIPLIAGNWKMHCNRQEAVALTQGIAAGIAGLVRDYRRADDIAVASIHWGANWGFQIPGAHRLFAHALIDRAGIDIVHGHSSHHPRAAEVYRGRRSSTAAVTSWTTTKASPGTRHLEPTWC